MKNDLFQIGVSVRMNSKRVEALVRRVISHLRLLSEQLIVQQFFDGRLVRVLPSDFVYASTFSNVCACKNTSSGVRTGRLY